MGLVQALQEEVDDVRRSLEGLSTSVPSCQRAEAHVAAARRALCVQLDLDPALEADASSAARGNGGPSPASASVVTTDMTNQWFGRRSMPLWRGRS